MVGVGTVALSGRGRRLPVVVVVHACTLCLCGEVAVAAASAPDGDHGDSDGCQQTLPVRSLIMSVSVSLMLMTQAGPSQPRTLVSLAGTQQSSPASNSSSLTT